MTVQYSRGCPFQCEFCDIIELYGRVPRAKASEQILAELDVLYAAGWRGPVDFVDDNFIGNKRAVKKFLPLLSEWQKKRGYPFRFQTEASINLSDDAELLKMMRAANFQAVFIGIESPDTETLVSAQKRQNTRRSLAESVHKVYDAGIYVVAGFIIGFDTEKDRVAEGMIEAIEAMSIPVCMVGLLFALQDTQLSRRLRKEGRMLPVEANNGDQCTGGLNFVTAAAEARDPGGLQNRPEARFCTGDLFRSRAHDGPGSQALRTRRNKIAGGGASRVSRRLPPRLVHDVHPAGAKTAFLEDGARLRRPQPRQPRGRANHDCLLPAPR